MDNRIYRNKVTLPMNPKASPIIRRDEEKRDALLGDLGEVFKPKPSSIVLGRLLSIVFFATGAVALGLTISAVYFQKAPAPGGNAWTAGRVFGCLLGVAFISGGTAIWTYCSRLGHFRLEIYEYGFKYWSRRLAAIVLWVDVVAIRESQMGIEYRISDDPSELGYEASIYTIVSADGTEYKVNSRDIENIHGFRLMLSNVASYFSLPWEITQTPWSWRKWLT